MFNFVYSNIVIMFLDFSTALLVCSKRSKTEVHNSHSQQPICFHSFKIITLFT
jgi:hypothetical protein